MVIETFFKLSIFVIPPRNWGAPFQNYHKELPPSTELLQTCPIKSVLFFKNKFGNILKKIGWGRFAHALMGHICACLFNVL